MSTMQHSPISPMDLDEFVWLQGYGIQRPPFITTYDDLPIEWESQECEPAGVVAILCWASCLSLLFWAGLVSFVKWLFGV